MKIKNKEQLIRYFKDNPIKMVALDLDRTTLHSDGTLADRTRNAILEVIEAGVEVVVISGRPRCSLPKSVLDIPGIRYLVTSNGAAVNLRKLQSDGLYTEQRVWAWTLDVESVLSILKVSFPYFEKDQITYETFVEGTAYAPESYVNQPTKYGVPEKAVSYVKSTRLPVEDFPEFIKLHAHELDSFDMIVADRTRFLELKEQLQKNVSGVYMTSSMDRMLEISHKDAGKGSGLLYVLQQLDLDKNSVIAFGDGDNDADMLEQAGVGVAMANAMPLCLEKADYISRSNDEYGVAEVLELLVDVIRNREC